MAGAPFAEDYAVSITSKQIDDVELLLNVAMTLGIGIDSVLSCLNAIRYVSAAGMSHLPMQTTIPGPADSS